MPRVRVEIRSTKRASRISHVCSEWCHWRKMSSSSSSSSSRTMSCILCSVSIFLWCWRSIFAPTFWLFRWSGDGLVFNFLWFLQAGYHPSCLHGLSMLVYWFWPILWHLEFRGCCGCLRHEFHSAECCRWCTLKSSIFMRVSSSSSYRIMYFIQYACSPVMLTSNFHTNVLEAIQMVGRRLVFNFLWFLQASYHSSCLYDLSCLYARLLILTHLTSWISRMLRMSLLWILQFFRKVSSVMRQGKCVKTLRFLFPLFLVSVWWWLFPLLSQWHRLLLISHEFYISLSCSLNSKLSM